MAVAKVFWCFLAVLAVSLVTPAAAGAQAAPCGTILDSFKRGDGTSVAVRSNGGEGLNSCAGYQPDLVDGIIYGSQYQCVEYVRRFYRAPDKSDPSYSTALRKWERVDAIDFYSNYLNLGLVRFKNKESQAPPQPYDIIVFDGVLDPSNNGKGHVAIVRQVAANSVQLIEQNFAAGDGGRLSLSLDPVSKNYTLGDHVSIHGVHYPVLAWLREEPTQPQIIRIDVFCTRFLQNDDYWVQGVIVDPNQVIQAANISGSNISGEIQFVYNLYEFRPGEWWTNSNIFISQGIEPDFPLVYTVHIWFKDGTYQEVNKIVTTWISAQ